MRTYDLTPLFRTSVGFDRMSRLMDSALQLEGAAKEGDRERAHLGRGVSEDEVLTAGLTHEARVLVVVGDV